MRQSPSSCLTKESRDCHEFDHGAGSHYSAKRRRRFTPEEFKASTPPLARPGTHLITIIGNTSMLMKAEIPDDWTLPMLAESIAVHYDMRQRALGAQTTTGSSSRSRLGTEPPGHLWRVRRLDRLCRRQWSRTKWLQ